MSDPGNAVFLSYASQDAEAAKRICEALRQAGVEVWFDQSELVGGDAWDQKIRGQIASCALFVPVISANTQARLEGYFRREWKQAASRTHDMADEKAFLLPVVIDGTRDAEAKVPAEFKAVQWTKLIGGETPVAFGVRVKKLLEGNSEDRGQRTEVRTENREPTSHGSGRATGPGSAAADIGKTANPTKPRWLTPVIAGAVIALLALVFIRPWEKAVPPPAEPSARRSAPTTPEPTVARQLVAKAWVLLNKPEMARAELDAADALCKRAAVLDATDPEVWAAWAHVNGWFCFHNLDSSAPRQEAAREYATRAMQLDSKSFEARLAQAFFWVRGEANSRRTGEAQSLLRELLRERPDEPRALFTLGYLLIYAPESETEGVALLEQLARNPGFAAVAWDEIGWAAYFKRDWAKAEAAIARSLAAQPYWNNLGLKITMAERVYGDMDLAEATLKQMPASALQEDWGIGFACEVYRWRREPLRAIAVLEGVSRDWIRYFFYNYPKAFLLGETRLMANQAAAARRDFQRARVLIEKQLADDPNNMSLLGLQARTLLYLGEKEEAEKIYRSLKELGGTDYLQFFFAPPESAIGFIRSMAESPRGDVIAGTLFSPASLRLDPYFDRFRAVPAFQALLAQLEADPRFSPKAQQKTEKSEQKAVPTPSLSTPPDAKSVAVLAFANLSDDKSNEYFSDGISEELLNVLAKVPKLKVAARTSSFYFKGRNIPIPEIAQKLGVAYVVEGSVRKAGNKVRVTAQLIKAADGFHVWSETYDRDLTDIFAVQDEIAKNILGVVKGSLMGEAELPHATATNLEAYTLYLQAQGAFARRGDAGLREAIRLYEAALAIDASYVPALVGLAQARVVLPNYAYLSGAKARETVDGAIKAARRALELDARNATAFSVIGWAKFQFDWQWVESEEALRRARDLAPNDSWTWNCLGDYHRFVGDLPQARVAKQREWDLDPLSPNSHWDQSYLHLVAGHLDEAIRWAEICIGLAPHNVDSYMPAILAAARSGQFDLAHRTIAAARQNVSEGEGMLLLLEAYSAILEKKPDEARRLLAKVAPLAEAENAPPSFLGYCHLLLGEAETASRWLQAGYDRHDPSMVWNEIIDFDVIAANPKTRPILDRPGLKELFEIRQRNARAGLNKL